MKKQKAYTLIELITTLSIICVVAVFVLPNLSHSIKQHRALTLQNTLLSLINYARSESITRAQTIFLCPGSASQPCNGDWQQGIVVVSKQQTGFTILRVASRGSDKQQLNFKGFPNHNYLQFMPSGLMTGNGTFLYTYNIGESRHYWKIIINNAGRARVES